MQIVRNKTSALLILIVILSACAPAPVASPTKSPAAAPTTLSPTTSSGSLIGGYTELLGALRATGVAVEPAGNVSQPFFPVEGHLVKVNGEDVQVFEFADNATMEQHAMRVSATGSSIGTTMVNWMASPHFFKKGKIIAIYVGDAPQGIGALQAVFGPQFAGR